MAKLSKMAREEQVIKTVKRYEGLVKKLKALMRTGSEAEQQDARRKFNRLPRRARSAAIQRRCQCCGRPRGVYRAFKLCRICLRELTMKGDVSGVRKASW